jgi:hypothetical protein
MRNTIIPTVQSQVRVRRVSCHHRMICPQVADGGDTLQLWRVAVNILNKQTRGGPLGWGLGVGPTTHHKQ